MLSYRLSDLTNDAEREWTAQVSLSRCITQYSNISEPFIGYLSLVIVEMNIVKLHMRKMLFCNEWSDHSQLVQLLLI